MNAKRDTPITTSKLNNNDHLLSQSFFNNTPIAIVIYKVINEGLEGKDYIIENANPKALKIENWIKEDIVGKPLSLVRPGVDDFGIVEVFQKVWKTGELSYFPARIYDNNGELKWLENTIFKLPTGQVVASYDDVTEQKLSEERLENEKERLRVTLYSIEDGVITTNSQGEVVSLNKVAEQLTGWTSKEAKGQLLNKIFDVFDKVTTAPSDNLADLVLKSKQVITLKEDSILRSVNGHTSPISGNIAPINRQDGSTIGTVLVFRDITEAKKREEKINYLSFKDSLTGLYNRAYFEEALVRYDVQSQMPVSLIMGDLDGLKLINDVFGHQAGDEALVKLAEIFTESCRSLDIISRWGGDEFVILLPRTSGEVAEKVCARIIEACDRTIVSDTILSVSLGYSTKTDLSQNWKNIFKVAEDNMYKNKLLGAKSYRNIVISSMKNALYEKAMNLGNRLKN